VNIPGKGILLQNLNITGGSRGVWVNRGSNAVLNNNLIQTSSGDGVLVDELAFAVLTNNTVQNHPGAGVLVSENSTARIGFNADTDTAASPNTIQNNSADGIIVSNGSSARIVGNNVNSNGANGIFVIRDSSADIASNTISDNADGIHVKENSIVQLGEDSGASIYQSSNATTSMNTGFAIRCLNGSVADGRIGALSGMSGTMNFSSECIDSVVP
jgi:parallel beta-helix repeat protein